MYKEIIIRSPSTEQKELLIAKFAEIAEGFDETGDDLKIYFSEDRYNESEILPLISNMGVAMETHDLAEQNWNQVWESNFQPVVVDDFVTVRASFHPQAHQTEHEIVITPKMSFGTGHHATTYLMMQQMRSVNFKGKQVFDFGTGTGILAILAEKLGARSVLATDIDAWSIANAFENIATNHCKNILLHTSDAAYQTGRFDIILANINRNVLLNALPELSRQLTGEGQLVLSGPLEEDEAIMEQKAYENSFRLLRKSKKDRWVCLYFKRL